MVCSSLFFCKKAGVIPFVKVNSSLELSVLHARPPSSTDWVHFVFPFPGKVQAFCLLVGFDTIIDVPMDGAKLKFSLVILSEGDIAWHHEVADFAPSRSCAFPLYQAWLSLHRSKTLSHRTRIAGDVPVGER